MKRHWIEYTPERSECPLTYWVHVGPEGEHWREAARTEPALPPPVAGHGFAVLHVEVDGCAFRFASLAELDVFTETLGQKVLPSSQRAAAVRGTGAGPNGHWLSRLPTRATGWAWRERALPFLVEAREAFAKELGAR